MQPQIADIPKEIVQGGFFAQEGTDKFNVLEQINRLEGDCYA